MKRLARDGYRVINIDVKPPDEETEGEVYLECDLADREATLKLASEIARDYQPICLVNNAAWARPATFDQTTVDDLDRTLAVNVIAPHVLCLCIAPSMRDAGFGRIVNISSVAARGKRARAAYATSKAAIEGYTKVLAIELGRDGITVNAVAPGPIDTPAFQAANPPGSAGRQAIEAQLSVPSLGLPEDVAEAVSFLTSREARFVTGQVLTVCGGRSIGGGR